jgi:hypothetical protein
MNPSRLELSGRCRHSLGRAGFLAKPCDAIVAKSCDLLIAAIQRERDQQVEVLIDPPKAARMTPTISRCCASTWIVRPITPRSPAKRRCQ